MASKPTSVEIDALIKSYIVRAQAIVKSLSEYDKMEIGMRGSILIGVAKMIRDEESI